MTTLQYPLVSLGTAVNSEFHYSISAATPPVSTYAEWAWTNIAPDSSGDLVPYLFIDTVAASSVFDPSLASGSITIQVVNNSVNPPTTAYFTVMVNNASIPAPGSSQYSVLNENIAIPIDVRDLLSPISISLSSNLPDLLTSITYQLYAPDTTLIGAAISGNILSFIPSQYGTYSVCVNAINGAPTDSTDFKSFNIDIIPPTLYTLADGQITCDFAGAETLGIHTTSFKIKDSNSSIITQTLPLSVKAPLAGIQVPDTLPYWVTAENLNSIPIAATVTLPFVGSLPGTSSIASPSSYTFANGLIASVTSNGIEIAPPASSLSYTARNASLIVPINLSNNMGTISTVIDTLVINANSLDLKTPSTSYPAFTVDIYTETYLMQKDFITLNPLKPYQNSPDIVREYGLIAQVASGNFLPTGLSLDSATGLIYGVAQSASSQTNYTVINFLDSLGHTVGVVNVHFDIVDSYAFMVDNKETPTSSRYLTKTPLTFGGATITRSDHSWTLEGVNPSSNAGYPTSISLSGFTGATGNNVVTIVNSVTDVFTTAGVFSSSILTCANGTNFTTDTADISGNILTQNFLRSATCSISGVVLNPSSAYIHSGHLPQGLGIEIAQGTIVITGIPQEFGEFDLTVGAVDSLGNTYYWVMSRANGTALVIPWSIPLEITTTSSQLPIFCPTGVYTNGVPSSISYTLQAQGGAAQGTGPYVWSIAANSSLPTGFQQPGANWDGTLTFSIGGDNFGTASVTFIVTDANGLSSAEQLTLQSTNNLTILTTSIPNFIPGSSSSFNLQAMGGNPPYVWTSSPLPQAPGPVDIFTLTSLGQLQYNNSGEATSTSVIFTVTDSILTAATNTNLLFVGAGGTEENFTFTYSLPNVQVGWPYTGNVVVSAPGYAPPFTWVLGTSGLPAGLTGTTSTTSVTNDTFSITGVATDLVPSSFILTLSVYDRNGYFDYFTVGGGNPYSFSIGTGLTWETTSLPQIGSPTYMYYGDPAAVTTLGIDQGDPVQLLVNGPPGASLSFSSAALSSVSNPFPGIILGSNGVLSGTYTGTTSVGPVPIDFTVDEGSPSAIDTLTTQIYMTAVPSNQLAILPSTQTLPLQQAGNSPITPISLTAYGLSPLGTAAWSLTTGLPDQTTNSIEDINGIFNPLYGNLSFSNGVISGYSLIGGTFPVSFQLQDSFTKAITNRGYMVTFGNTQVFTAGPDFYSGTTPNGYIGCIRETNPGNIGGIVGSNGSFTIIVTGINSKSQNQLSVTLQNPSIISASVSVSAPSNGSCVISVTNLPISNTTGDVTFGIYLTDDIVTVPYTVKYKVIDNRQISLLQTIGTVLSPLPTENV